MIPIRYLMVIVPMLGLLQACATGSKPRSAGSSDASFSLLMPQRVRIVQPFTRVQSDHETDRPDAIELLVQAVNSLDNPGLMIVGRLRVELYEYVPASADHKARQLERWTVDLSSEADQRTYWNALTQMYEFRLAVDPMRIPLADKYVLSVTYDSPLGDRLTDECMIAYRRTARR